MGERLEDKLALFALLTGAAHVGEVGFHSF